MFYLILSFMFFHEIKSQLFLKVWNDNEIFKLLSKFSFKICIKVQLIRGFNFFIYMIEPLINELDYAKPTLFKSCVHFMNSNLIEFDPVLNQDIN